MNEWEHPVPRPCLRGVRPAICRPAAVSHAAARTRAGVAPLGHLRAVLAKTIRRRRQQSQRFHLALAGNLRSAARAAGRGHPKGNRRDGVAKTRRAKRSALRARRVYSRRHARTQTAAQVKEQITRDGPAHLHLRTAEDGDIFAIADPNLHLDQLEQVQRDVAMLLEQGVNPPVVIGETPPAEETAPAS